MKNIVTIGAGTGQASITQGLSTITPNTYRVNGIVCTTDNGGSTGEIRKIHNIPAMGDARQVLNTYLTQELLDSLIPPPIDQEILDGILTYHYPYQETSVSIEQLIKEALPIINSTGSHTYTIDDLGGEHSARLLANLLKYRFSTGTYTGIHLGNLIITAMTLTYGTLTEAFLYLQRYFGIQHKVLPVSDIPTDIVAVLENGTTIKGERQILKRTDTSPTRVYKHATSAPITSEVKAVLDEADICIITPGVLGTGTLSTLLHPGMKEALLAKEIPIIYFCNAMTYHNDTDHCTVSDHIHALELYLGKPIDTIIIPKKPSLYILDIYARMGSTYVEIDHQELEGKNVYIEDILLNVDEKNVQKFTRPAVDGQYVGAHLIQSDAKKVASVITKVIADLLEER